jgi:hypothetical protein
MSSCKTSYVAKPEGKSGNSKSKWKQFGQQNMECDFGVLGIRNLVKRSNG